jgi:hypothetical protein
LRHELWSDLLLIEKRRRANLEDILYGPELLDQLAEVRKRLDQLHDERRAAPSEAERGLFALPISQAEGERQRLWERAARTSRERLTATAHRWRKIQQTSEREVREAAGRGRANGMTKSMIDDVVARYYASRQQACLHHCGMKLAPPMRLVVRFARPGLAACDTNDANGCFQLTPHQARIRIGAGDDGWLEIPISYQPTVPANAVIVAVFATCAAAQEPGPEFRSRVFLRWTIAVTFNETKG